MHLRKESCLHKFTENSEAVLIYFSLFVRIIICRESERNLVLRASVWPQREHIAETEKTSLMLILKDEQCSLMLLPNYTCAYRYRDIQAFEDA